MLFRLACSCSFAIVMAGGSTSVAHRQIDLIAALMNPFILKQIKLIEMTGVVMRISNFSLVSWLGPHSTFLFVWMFNTLAAVAPFWCDALKKDAAYTLLKVFRVVIGALGFARTSGLLSHGY
jgi:hypothetical protein